ncbi:MAG TPA: hypothetical protein VGJ14_08585 [Sporichthyaceae bacterium]|jgi:hypothetical protein
MQKSLASSSLVPLVTVIGAGLLIFGTLTNGSVKDSGDPSLASASSACDPTFGCASTNTSAAGSTAGAPAPGPADTSAASAPAPQAYTLVIGEAEDAGGVTMTVTKATKSAATVTIDKKTYTLKLNKATKVGANTLTYNGFKGKSATVTVG